MEIVMGLDYIFGFTVRPGFSFQAWVYCTYGPICSALKHAYGWTDAMVAMTANAGTAAYLVFTWPVRTPK